MPGAPAAAAPVFALEEPFQRTLARLKAPRSRWTAALLLVGSLAAFLLVQQRESGTALNLAALVGVLLLHESGHWVAMRALGWQDVRMFFIPFFGAAVSGRRAGAATWKEGVVLLAGPVPGLLLGLALAAVIRTEGSPALRTVSAMLLALNAFNLLPLAVLDGGRLLQLTIFQRHRLLETAFLVLAALGMVAASIKLEDKVLGYVALFTVITLPARYRLLRAAQGLRERQVPVPGDARELDGEAGRQVFAEAWNALDEKRRSDANVAATLEGLVELVSRSIPNARQTASLLAAWGLALAGGAGGFWLLKHPALEWREVADPGGRYTLQLPGEPYVQELPQKQLDRTVTVRQLGFARGDYGFVCVDLPLAEDAEIDMEAWWQHVTGSMAGSTKGKIVTSGPEPFQGKPGMAARIESGGNRTRMVGFQHAGHHYLLVATAPAQDGAVERFFSSVQLKD